MDDYRRTEKSSGRLETRYASPEITGRLENEDFSPEKHLVLIILLIQ